MAYKQIAVYSYDQNSFTKANEFLKSISEKNNLSSILFEKERIIIVYFESSDKHVL